MRLSSSSLLILLPLLACGGGGGGSTPAPAPAQPKLVYTDPTSGSYRLVRNAALSTNQHLVLDLVGPSGSQGRGLAFALTAEAAKATWSKPEAGDPEVVAPAGFDLGAAPRILKVRLTGGTLRAAYAQQGPGVPAKNLGVPLGRVALDLVPGASGTIALGAAECQVLPDTGAPQDVTLTLGTLTIQR